MNESSEKRKEPASGAGSDREGARPAEHPERQDESLKVHGDKLERLIPKK